MSTALRGHAEMLPRHGHSEQWPWHPTTHWLHNYHYAVRSRACARSAIRSSEFSTPQDMRIMLSEIP